MTTWRDVARWLTGEGFAELRGGATGHTHYVHASGVKVTICSLGRARREPKPGELAGIVRQLERCGYDRRAVKHALGMD